jgi:hypothetical protein
VEELESSGTADTAKGFKAGYFQSRGDLVEKVSFYSCRGHRSPSEPYSSGQLINHYMGDARSHIVRSFLYILLKETFMEGAHTHMHTRACMHTLLHSTVEKGYSFHKVRAIDITLRFHSYCDTQVIHLISVSKSVPSK